MQTYAEIRSNLEKAGLTGAGLNGAATIMYDMLQTNKSPSARSYFSLVDEANRKTFLGNISQAMGDTAEVSTFTSKKTGESGLSVSAGGFGQGSVQQVLAGSRSAWTFSPEQSLKNAKAAMERLEKSAAMLDRLVSYLETVVQEGKI